MRGVADLRSGCSAASWKRWRCQRERGPARPVTSACCCRNIQAACSTRTLGFSPSAACHAWHIARAVLPRRKHCSVSRPAIRRIGVFQDAIGRRAFGAGVLVWQLLLAQPSVAGRQRTARGCQSCCRVNSLGSSAHGWGPGYPDAPNLAGADDPRSQCPEADPDTGSTAHRF